MITQLLTISLLSLGIISGSGTSTASAFLDTPKKANENENLAPFEIEIGEGTLTSENTINDTANQTRTRLNKYEITEQEHLAMRLDGNIYYQEQTNYYEEETYPYEEKEKIIVANTSYLIVYNITAYKYMTEANNNIFLRMRYNINESTIYPSNTKIITETLVTTEDWSFLLDNATTNPNLNNDLYNRITNPAYGYNYSQTTNITTIQTVINGGSYANVNNEIALTGHKNNYVVLKISLQANSSVEIIRNNEKFINIQTNNISGYYLPNVENYEVIDIPNLLLQIITMPFSFISMAFNLTLFPGTPFQLNLSNLFLSIIALLIFIWLLKLVISIAGKV